MFKLDDLRLPDNDLYEYVQRQRRLPWRLSGKFIRAIPFVWISRAADLRESALRVALLLWWQAGLQRRSHDLTLPTEALRKFHVKRLAYYRTLRALEAAGLITVDRQPGRKARVTIETVKS